MDKKHYLFLLVVFLIATFLISGCTLGGKQTSSSEESSGENKEGMLSSVTGPECGNGNCESEETSQNCCEDCGCDRGYHCIGGKCQSKCGDGIKVAGETSENCCKDAGCPTGETCENNECIILKPEFEVSFTQMTDSQSVTYLKATEGNIGQITLENTGNDDASNVKVTLSTPTGYFSDTTTSLGTINEGLSKTESIDVNFLKEALKVTTDETITINADTSYQNSVNEEYSSEDSFNLEVGGRNYLTWGKPGMVASWVTPTQSSVREFASKATSGLPAGMEDSDPAVQKMAARWLFESMKSYGIDYVNDAHSSADYIQFPYETLNNNAGDCDDLAVLYASLLESIGLDSFLVIVPNHIFAGYVNSRGYAVPIETTASDFDSAISLGSSEYSQYKDDKEIIYPSSQWDVYSQVNLVEDKDVKLPYITREFEEECTLSWGLSLGFYAKTEVTFTNSGGSPGAGCAAVLAYNKNTGEKVDEEIHCETINPGESKTVTYKSDFSMGDIGEGYCRNY